MTMVQHIHKSAQIQRNGYRLLAVPIYYRRELTGLPQLRSMFRTNFISYFRVQSDCFWHIALTKYDFRFSLASTYVTSSGHKYINA
jgi:hypothetical protein